MAQHCAIAITLFILNHKGCFPFLVFFLLTIFVMGNEMINANMPVMAMQQIQQRK